MTSWKRALRSLNRSYNYLFYNIIIIERLKVIFFFLLDNYLSNSDGIVSLMTQFIYEDYIWPLQWHFLNSLNYFSKKLMSVNRYTGVVFWCLTSVCNLLCPCINVQYGNSYFPAWLMPLCKHEKQTAGNLALPVALCHSISMAVIMPAIMPSTKTHSSTP